MRQVIKIGMILFGIGILAAIGTYLYVFYKPHRNIARENPAYIMEAKQLLSDFIDNEDSSYIKYGDKVLQISGPVSEVSTSMSSGTISMLNDLNGITFGFDSLTISSRRTRFESISKGDTITIKGKCDGYDMIMGVVLTRSILLSQ